jgi:hypothetical protein
MASHVSPHASAHIGDRGSGVARDTGYLCSECRVGYRLEVAGLCKGWRRICRGVRYEVTVWSSSGGNCREASKDEGRDEGGGSKRVVCVVHRCCVRWIKNDKCLSLGLSKGKILPAH